MNPAPRGSSARSLVWVISDNASLTETQRLETTSRVSATSPSAMSVMFQ